MTNPISTTHSAYARAWLVGIAYFALATISIYFSRGEATVAHFWYPNAVGIVFLLRCEKQFRWYMIAVLALANAGANWICGSSLWLSLTFVVPNLIEMLATIWFIRHDQIEQDFDQSPKHMLRFVLQICLPSSVLGALAGASILAISGFAQFLTVLPLWFVSSSVGMLALLPFLLVLNREALNREVLQQEHAEIEWNLPVKKPLIFYAIIVSVVSYLALRFFPFPFIYLVIPLIFAAVETDTKTVTALIFLQSMIIGVMIHLGLFVPSMNSVYGLVFLNYLPILVTFIPVFMLTASMNLFRSQNTQKGLMEEALRRNHVELQTIVDNVPALIGLWDKNFRNVFANRMYTTYFGVKPEDILGKHVREVVGESIYAKNLPYLEAAMRGDAQMFERTIIDPEGRARESITSYVPSYRDGEIEGVFVFISDITEVRKAQQAESAAQARLQSVIDSATEFSIIATDTVGIIRLFSKGAEKMLGYSSTELVNRQSPAILHSAEEVTARGRELSAELKRNIAGFEVFVVKAREGVNETREWTYLHKTGRQIPVRLVVTAMFDSNENITGYLGIANDISDEKELQQLLINAKEAAEQTSRAKSDFVANMSHEIRTPMNAVLGMSQLLAATYLNAEQRKYLEMIKTSGQSLLGILNDILDFSKIEANRLELSQGEFLLDDILGALASMMAVSVGDKDIEVAIGVDVGVPKRLVGDQLRLQQVLTNLVGNALKFTAQGEVAIFVEKLAEDASEELVLGGARPPIGSRQIKLRFSIRDTGIGMNAQQTQKLFQPFFQADASTTRQYGGTGLGLSISKRILDMMGGDIEVSSQIGHGTEFQVVVPLIALDDFPNESSEPNPKQLRLLVVDDNLTSNDYICRTIRSWDWLVESATSGPQALELVRVRMASQEMYDVVLVDWQLPDMDGLTSIKYLREMVPGHTTSFVIMVSAYSRDHILHQPSLEYADAILMKPITGSSIFDTVHEAIALNVDSAHLSPHRKSTTSRPWNMPGTKFLLVEDNPFNQIVAKGFLEQGGASVVVLDNGQLAVDHLRMHADQYDAILMDVQMPILDGINATKIIRTELQLDIPIIAMSAGVMYSERDRCLRSGMNDFVAKPVDIDQMFSVIAKYLSKPLTVDAKEKPADIKSVRMTSKEATDAIILTSENADADYFNPIPFEKLARAAPESLPKILVSIKGVVEQGSQQWALVRQSINTQAWEDAARLLHSMRGAVGSLGAKSFAALTLQLEKQILAADFSDLENRLAKAELDLDRSLGLAQAWLRQHETPASSPSAPADSLSLNEAALAQLRLLLQENNMQACDVFENLRPAFQAKLSEPLMQQLSNAISNLDFKTALQLLIDVA
ncbi:response regulator [Undibacterium flavidum]|uniref:histidine kinase n=1 Tax=Undibacterium flavidum TaxID=2762297 RepID=A0ABR6YGZ7_9BURK|nr:response regulator [Undibacterium flavidum]MBC3875813.1 response regulator [Undibacterium flavidum]